MRKGSFGTQDRPNIDRQTSLAALTCLVHTAALSEHNNQAKSEPAILLAISLSPEVM